MGGRTHHIRCQPFERWGDCMNGEQWKQVPSVPFLQASDFGRIRVAPHKKPMPRGGIRIYGGHASRGLWDGKRFIFVVRQKTYKVSRLVCEAFNGPPSDGKNVCLHLDEDAKNNTPKNLKWGTQKENLNGPKFLAYCRARVGTKSPTIKARMKKIETQKRAKK